MNDITPLDKEDKTMPYCPDCKTYFNEDIMICSKCNGDLLPGIVSSQVSESVDWYVVQSVPNEVVGYILKSVLEDEGIEVYLRSFEIPFWGGVKGTSGKSEWGDLLVPTYSVQQALECIKNYYASIKDN